MLRLKPGVIKCECCGRQILPGNGVLDEFVTYGGPYGPKRLLSDQYVCAECSTGLDEYGLFPEESFTKGGK